MDFSTNLVASLAVGFGVGLLVGYGFRFKQTKISSLSDSYVMNLQPSSFSAEYLKMVMVVRTDLKMGKGKIAAQCCHATLAAYQKALKMNPEYVKQWTNTGQQKVVVKTENEQSLLELYEIALSLKLPAQVIQDAGRTQIEPGSLTVLGIGPAPSNVLDNVTGNLKLL